MRRSSALIFPSMGANQSHPESPQACADAKAVTPQAWDALLRGCGGSGPELSPEDTCKDCLKDQRQHDRQQEAFSQHRTVVMQELEECHEFTEGFFVSKSWLRQALIKFEKVLEWGRHYLPAQQI